MYPQVSSKFISCQKISKYDIANKIANQYNCNVCMRKCFKFIYRDRKMFLLKLESKLQNLIKKSQSTMKI